MKPLLRFGYMVIGGGEEFNCTEVTLQGMKQEVIANAE